MTTEQIMKVCVGPLGRRIVKDDMREVAVFVEGKTMVVGFGPTMGNVKDWIRNLDIDKVENYSPPDDPICGHYGFIIEYLQSSEALRMAIQSEVSCGVDHIIFAGFSQGGAHAQIACFDWMQRVDGVKVDSITFGSPRVFSKRGAKLFDRWRNSVTGSSVNVILSKDVVSKLPWKILGYQDAGRRMVFGGVQNWIFGNLSVHTPDSYLELSKKLDLGALL